MEWLLTGGAGFIGANVALHLASQGHSVHVMDDLSRAGSEANAELLTRAHDIGVRRVDVSDRESLWDAWRAIGDVGAVVHLAGQVSMAQSLRDPYRDFEVNALGTLNVLEYVRRHAPQTAVIGFSSNKIYGSLSHIAIEESATRYEARMWSRGFDESLPLCFETPYGCSKGTADQYLGDYASMYGLRTVSLRQSSVYGPLQNAREDQGWVVYLVTQAMAGNAIRLNGNGKQVRDLLHVSDLAQLIEQLPANLTAGTRNQVNVGGGPSNALSILELFSMLAEDFGIHAKVEFGSPRVSDQLVFVSSNESVGILSGWRPRVSYRQGVSQIVMSGHQ